MARRGYADSPPIAILARSSSGSPVVAGFVAHRHPASASSWAAGKTCSGAWR